MYGFIYWPLKRTRAAIPNSTTYIKKEKYFLFCSVIDILKHSAVVVAARKRD